MTYRTGPGFTDSRLRLRLEVHNKNETRAIYNVIGTITGRTEPDRYVLMGNHRDAWVFGAADPVSGTSVLMEVARGLGTLLGAGWRPRRTVMLCSWDAEEIFVVGSTEWVEENSNVLWDRAVVYLNTDVAVGGDFSLNVDSSPVLCDFLLAATKDLPAPHGRGKSLYDVMIERDVTKHRHGVAKCDNLPFGSDYGAFYHFTGVSSADWSYIFGGKYGIRRSYSMYHSVHDTFNWMKTFVDPDFEIHLAVARYSASVLLKFADAPLLPFNATRYAAVIKKYSHSLVSNSRLENAGINLGPLSKAVDRFEKAARDFEAFKAEYLQIESTNKSFRVLNDQMAKLERAFIQTVEENNPRQLRHVIYGPNLKNMYGGVVFPRVHWATQDAMRSHNWDRVRREVSVLLYHISSAAKLLEPVLSGSNLAQVQCA